jgi:diguanylate cyclase (GGDEF)-like protein/PAS domain S-box-containing protein
MASQTRLTAAELDTLLETLLVKNPQAPVMAIDASTGLFVPMPDSVPLRRQRIVEGRSTALELVVSSEVESILTTWEQARQHGAAHVKVHAAWDPASVVTISYIDATHSHGVYIGLVEGVAEAGAAFVSSSLPIRPRLAVIKKNELATILDIDEATTQLLGWTADEMVSKRSLEFLDAEDHQRAISSWIDMLRQPGSRRRVRLRHRRKDGSWLWFEMTNHNLLHDPAHKCVLTEMLDISDEMAAQEALRAREHLLRRLTESLPLGVFQVDTEKRIVYRNDRLVSIVGRPRARTVDQQFKDLSGRHRARLHEALHGVLREGKDTDLSFEVRHKMKTTRHCTLSLRALTDDSGAVTGAIGCVNDVSADVSMRQELETRATYDVLTRCRNRASVLALLEAALANQSATSRSGIGVIFVDLDRFKEINDRLGHAAGDELLVHVAERLRQSVRGNDVIGRLGGDEFLVVCPRMASAAEALRVAERIASSVAQEIVLGGQRLKATVSLGVAWSSGAREDADSLIARADTAMYESKRARLGQPVLARAA